MPEQQRVDLEPDGGGHIYPGWSSKPGAVDGDPLRKRDRAQRKTSSTFKGVHWNGTKWQASIRVDDKPYHLGVFLVEEDAARAYNVAATKYFGEFARPDFKP